MKLTDYTFDYLEECEKGKKLSKQTMKAYRIDLKKFMNYYENHPTEPLISVITEYIYVMNTMYASKTVKRRRASLHAFFEYLIIMRQIDENPVDKVKFKIKQEKRLPRIIHRQDLQRFYEILYKSNSKDFYSLRNIAILELLISTGIRVSELCNLMNKDINLEDKSLYVFGKGSKERLIYLGSNLVLEALKQYSMINNHAEPNKPFFLNRYGSRITDQSIRNIIVSYTIKAGIQDKITPHMFRHTFATLLLDADVDIRYIQNILGHSSITTTQIYTHVSTAKMQEILIYKNPRNQIVT